MRVRGLWLIAVIVAIAMSVRPASAATDYVGRVTFGGLPVPGATVTAIHRDQQLVTITDQQGMFHFAAIGDGLWTIRVEMLGFASATQDITIPADAPASSWEMKLLPFAEMTRDLKAAAAAPAPARRPDADDGSDSTRPAAPSGIAPAPTSPPAGFQRAQVNASADGAALVNDPAAAGDADRGGADGFLVNGSVNNGAASPFAQLAAFGNNRRNVRSLYNGGVGVLLGNSALDARPFSFTGQPTAKPAYTDAQIMGSFAGPLRIPNLLRNGPNMFLGYQRTVDHNASTQSALMPTPFERAGDFSQTRDALGRPIQLVDPAIGRPFAGNVIPRARLSPQAVSLLNYYPLPNLDAAGRFNYQAPVLATRHQDAGQARFTQSLRGGRSQLFGTLALQRTTTDEGDVFGFTDSSRASGIDTIVNWSHRFSQLLSLRLRYQFTRLANSVTPYFANRTNVSGDAGIAGNDQDPVNWGAPRLLFASGVAGFASRQAAENSNTTHGWGAEILSSRGRHNITWGGDVRRQRWRIRSQQDGRGAFGFSGATGFDLADFMLGLPHSSSIAFGNADKDFAAPAYDAYVTDDWRVSPILTVNAGIRWEYEGPIDERLGRLANLDVAPGFSSIRPVVGNGPVRGDARGFQPRVGLALRPVPGSSLVIRAGYGIYRNTSVYQPIATLLAQQPPLSKTLSVESSAANPLTLADGFHAAPGTTPNTFAVDPHLRVGYAHNWQILAQRDLPASLTMTATYLGTHGSHLLQEFLPNTVPAGAVNPCPACPAGFIYLFSNGRSDRHTGQLQLRRRLRNGLTATVQYALSTAMDDASAFTGVSTNGSAIAQDWLHPETEWAASNFDQRHLLAAQLQYTTGAGVSGGGLMDGAAAKFFRGWTLTGQVTSGSGLPITPVYLTSVAGTGVTGTIRASLTGAPTDAATGGSYLNPAAYSAPAAGAWGNAGRNSITGPGQFSLDAGIGRTFLWGDRLNLDWRANATNVLNRVTYAAVNAFVGSPQFGLPTIANPMRKVQTSIRVRF